MERRKCRRCGHPMTRIITQTIEPGGSHWKACYTCISCGCETAAQKAKRELEAYKGARLRYEEEIARMKRMAAEKWEE